MEPKLHEHNPAEMRGADNPVGAVDRKLKAALKTIFQDARLQSADVPMKSHAHLRPALSQLCRDARRSGLRAEQLLVIIKDAWAGTPAGIAQPMFVNGDERLSAIISMCVDEYYDDGERSL